MSELAATGERRPARWSPLRFVSDVNGLRLHVLESGWEAPGRPCVLLLHGFPELAYSWRKVMPPLAAAGYHVVAPDQRGYGRTTGWSANYDDDLRPFRLLNAVRDAMGLVAALGYRSVAAVVGHDFGASVAAWCALVRPDVFRSVALMSAPFAGPPDLPFDTEGQPPEDAGEPDHPRGAGRACRGRASTINGGTRPGRPMRGCGTASRVFTTSCAPISTTRAPTGRTTARTGWPLERRTSWRRCRPTTSWTSADDMPAAVAKEMPSPAEIAACRWLPDRELAVYAGEYQRNGFQGGLNWYRSRSGGAFESELQLFAGRTIDVPSIFISGKSDWGVYQRPGAFERMQGTACTRMVGCHLLEGAGHWVQQEQAEARQRLLRRLPAAARVLTALPLRRGATAS